MTVVIDFGNILYWAAIIIGGWLAIGVALNVIGALFSKETWVQPTKVAYVPPGPDVWFWRGVWGVLIAILAMGAIGLSVGWIK